MEEESVLQGPDAAICLPGFQKNVSIIEILFQGLKKNGENIAVVEADTEKTITFSEFLKKSITIAANLSKHGLTEGDTVMLCLDKSILAYSLLAAVIFTGGTAALRQPIHSDKDEFQQQINICQPKIIFCPKECYEKLSLSEIEHKAIFFFMDGTSPQVESNILLERNNKQFTIYQVKDIQNHFPLILITSGTTGPSKFALIPNISFQRQAYSFCDDNTRKFLVVAPFCWISSTITFVSSIIKNYTMILSVPDPILHLQRSQLYKVDTWMIHPPLMLALSNVSSLSNFDITSVKTIIAGGSTLSVHLKKTFVKKLFNNNIDVNFLFGMTEAGILTTFRDVDPEITGSTLTSGKLASGVKLKVVDDNGHAVGPRVEGEIRVKTDSMMAKYVGNPEATMRAFDSKGWYRTGDAGYYDENGLIYALGRVSDLVQYKDKKISITRVEGLLVTHPAVHDAVVAAKPHPVDNQHPAAFVVLKPNFKVTTDEIQTYVDDQVEDNYRLRGGVYFVDSIPTLVNGKVLRYIFQKKFQD